MSVIGIDLGGTKVLAAVVSDDGTVTERAKVATPTGGPDEVVTVVADLVGGLEDRPSAVGLGVPGPVADGVLLEAPNLSGFDQPVPLGERLAAALGVPVALGNDANVGTLGEQRHGAAAGRDDVLGCWLGTGIGGGVVLGGRLHVGVSGTAGELGHVPVSIAADARRCGCGRYGCVEAYAGRASLAAAVDEAMAAGEGTELREIMADKGKDRLTSGVWKAALKAEDPVAVRLMDLAVEALGAAVADVINLLDVDTVVFGGGLAEKLGQDHVDRIAAAAQPRLMAPDVERRWVVASLGDDAGVVGAAALARG